MKREDVKASRPIRNRRTRDDAQMIADIGLLADRLIRNCPPQTKILSAKARRAVPLFEQAIAAAAKVEARIAEQKARIA